MKTVNSVIAKRTELFDRIASRVVAARLYSSEFMAGSPAADWEEAMRDLSDAERIIRLCQEQLEWAMNDMERQGRQWLPADMIVAVQDARAFLGLPRAVPRDQRTDGSVSR